MVGGTMEQSDIIRYKAHQKLANLSGETKDNYKNTPIAEWEKAISGGINAGVDVNKFIEEARQKRGIEKGSLLPKLNNAVRDVAGNVGGFGWGVLDSAVMDLVPDSWYSNANNVNAVNAGKSAETGAELAFALPALARLGSKAIGKATTKLLPKVSGWIADDVAKTPKNVAKMLKTFNKTANADDLAKGFKEFQDAQKLASNGQTVAKVPTIDDFIATKTAQYNDYQDNIKRAKNIIETRKVKLAYTEKALETARGQYDALAKQLEQVTPAYQMAIKKGYKPTSKSITNYKNITEQLKGHVDNIGKLKDSLLEIKGKDLAFNEELFNYTTEADNLMQNVISPLQKAREMQQALELSKKTITTKELLKGAHSAVKAVQLVNYMNNISNPDSDRGVNNPFNPRNIREYEKNVISNSFMPMGMPLNQ